MPLLQSAWLSPEQSVGNFVGSKKGITGTTNCWKLKAPVEDQFKLILEQVKHQLQEVVLHVPSSAPLGYDVFMIGKTPERSKPYIMFHCRKKEPREKAMEAIKSGQLLKEHPGLEVGHWRYPPDAPNLQASMQDDPQDGPHSGSRPLFSTKNYQLFRINDPEAERQAGPPAEKRSQPRPLGLLAQIRRRNLPDAERAATAALSISHAGQRYLVTTAHVFIPLDEEVEQSEAGGTDDDDDDWVLSGSQGLEPGVDLPTIKEIEEERLVSTTSYAVRAPPLDAPASFWADMDPDEFSKDLSTESGPHQDETMPSPGYVLPQFGIEGPVDKTRGTFDYCALVNTSLDYALLGVSPGLTHHFQELRSDTVLSIDAPTIEVVTTDQRGVSKGGILENRPTYMRLPYGDSFEAVYPVRLAEPPQKGDSGAAVVEGVSGKILGHIVVASLEASTVYIIPATKILADIQVRAEILVPDEPSMELKIGSTAQHAGLGTSGRLKNSSVPGDSGYTSIPFVVLPEPITVPEQGSSESQQQGPSRVAAMGFDSVDNYGGSIGSGPIYEDPATSRSYQVSYRGSHNSRGSDSSGSTHSALDHTVPHGRVDSGRSSRGSTTVVQDGRSRYRLKMLEYRTI